MFTNQQLDDFYPTVLERCDSVLELNQRVIVDGDLLAATKHLIALHGAEQIALLGIYRELIAARHQREAGEDRGPFGD